MKDEDKARQITEDLNYSSAEISKILRAINLGLLAVIWGLLVSPAVGGGQIDQESRQVFLASLALPLTLCIAALTADFLQYVASYFKGRRMLSLLLKGKHNMDATWNPKDPFYVATVGLFYIKIVLTGCAVIFTLRTLWVWLN